MRVYAEKPDDRIKLRAKATVLQATGTVQRTAAEHPLLQLQRQHGNRLVQQVLSIDRASEQPIQAESNDVSGFPADAPLFEGELARVVEQSRGGLQVGVIQRGLDNLKRLGGRSSSSSSRRSKGSASSPIPASPTASAIAVPALDPGGRGIWALDEKLIALLNPGDTEELRDLQGVVPASLKRLDRLLELRCNAGGNSLPREAGTPEHMRDAWDRSTTKQDFETWAKGHAQRMHNSIAGHMREQAYQQAFEVAGVGARSRVVPAPFTPKEQRQVDLFIQGHGGQPDEHIEIKSGPTSLTTAPRQSGGHSKGSSSHSSLRALELDSEFVQAGKRVTWVLEKAPTGQLVKFARGIGVNLIIRVDDAEERAKMLRRISKAQLNAKKIHARRAGGKPGMTAGMNARQKVRLKRRRKPIMAAAMDSGDIGTLRFFIGTKDKLVAHVVKEFKAK